VVPFAVMDAKIMHKDKDWGGENMVEKWFQVAKDLGVTLVEYIFPISISTCFCNSSPILRTKSH